MLCELLQDEPKSLAVIQLFFLFGDYAGSFGLDQWFGIVEAVEATAVHVWNLLEFSDSRLNEAEIGVLGGQGMLHVDIKII